MKRIIYIVLSLLLLVCLIPLLGVLWSSWFAAQHECVLHEGYATACIVNGVDRGPDIHGAFLLGWFMLISLPVGAGILLILITMGLVDLVRWMRRRPLRRR